MVLKQWLLVFLGGGSGSLFRYGIAIWMATYKPAFPWATLLANALSCFILGLMLPLVTRNALPTSYRLALMTGFCGGFSTFSTFTAESWQLFQQGRWEYAMGNVAVNLTVCVFCLYLGIKFTV